MAKIAPYLIGGFVALLIADVVPVPSLAQQVNTLRTAVAAPAPLLGTPASSVNRSAKSDREMFVAHRFRNLDLATNDVQPRGDGVVRTLPHDAANEPPLNVKPPPRSKIKLPVGCESAFSSVAAPSLAHHIGRCMSSLETDRLHG